MRIPLKTRFQLLPIFGTTVFFNALLLAHDSNILKSAGTLHPPLLVVQTEGRGVQDRTRTLGSLTMLTPGSEPQGGFVPADYAGPVEISVRGNSSFRFVKKSYRLELQDDAGNDKKVPLLGLPADSDWVLLGTATDRSFVRNLLAHEVWRRMGHHAMRWRFVELFLITNSSPESSVSPADIAAMIPGVLQGFSSSGIASKSGFDLSASNSCSAVLSNSYLGVYVLMEKIKRGKDRVNVQKLRPEHDGEPEITGGYIIKKDDLGRGERGLLTGQEFYLRYEEPKESELTPVQKKWMTKYFADFEQSLFGTDFRDPVRGYANYLDVESFVDFHWLVEVSRNADGYFFSQYMHKDRGGKITMGPVWDFDSTFGNPFFLDSQKTDGWRFESAPDPDYTWFRRLFEDPDFLQRYVDRWSELRTNILATSNVLALVDDLSRPLKDAVARNRRRWHGIGMLGAAGGSAEKSYDEELARLELWITERLAWIDSQEFPKPQVQIFRETPASPASITMTCPTGRLFYTTNRQDPRMRGGGVSPAAVEYRSPILLTTNLSVFARSRSEYGLWSAPLRLDAR